MFNHLHYVPVLKWKLGEYQALSRLSAPVKDRVTPLIEVPAVSYDFENSRTAKSLDDHLKDFGRRLNLKWQSRPCFVDTRYIKTSERMTSGSHPLAHVMELARDEGCSAVPVISLANSDAHLDAARQSVELDQRGCAIRLQLEDFDRPDIVTDIETVFRVVNFTYGGADLIIDLADKQFLPVSAFVQTLETAIAKIPALNRWRTFTIAGTSYPKTLQDIGASAMVPRREWSVYKAFVAHIGEDMRLPTFGDYVVAHPDPVELDMRLIKPFAKLRYTTSDEWYIAKGKAVRTSGFEQYRSMCNTVTQQSFYDGPDFSEGDRYIKECAVGTVSTGNLTTWVWVASNRHISRVVDDLANFHGA